jgi:hypothetical protein
VHLVGIDKWSEDKKKQRGKKHFDSFLHKKRKEKNIYNYNLILDFVSFFSV